MRDRERKETMLGLGFQEKKSSRSGFKARDNSPDSVIFTNESNFSLFSSTSASVDRCSFASDIHDHDSLVSENSMHLAGRELHDSSSGPDQDSSRSTVQKNSHLIKKGGGKTKDREEEEEIEPHEDNVTLDLSTECQNRRFRSEGTRVTKKPDRRRPASLDLNNRGIDATGSSPRLGVMKKSSISSRRSGTFPSPGTPNYRHGSVGIQKGWSSERVPLPANGSRRYVSSALLPFNNGRTLPSKWEDAEKWIFSPVSGDGFSRPSLPPPQRRPKSKSGPLGPPGNAFYSTYSPTVPMYEGGGVVNFMARSPFSTGVMVADGLSGHCGGGGGISYPAPTEPCILRSASVNVCSDLLSHRSLPGSQEGKIDEIKDVGTMVSHTVSRRDMATQMSPEGSTHSSPKGRSSFSPCPSLLPFVEIYNQNSSKPEIRDVQVDDQVTMTRWSKRHGARVLEKELTSTQDWKKKAVEARASAWFKREEAKITAWENLQKAKADASMRKLEMKLEKKRSSAMDKIMNKLRLAQRKAQDMRSSVSSNQARQVTRTSSKEVSFRKTGHISSFSGCFTCHAF